MKKTHVLMTGAGAPGGPGILRCLQQDPSLHITVADRNPNASGRFLNTCGSFWQIPDAKDFSFVEQVLSFCLQNEVEVIFPLVTMELFHFAANKKLFSNHGIKVIVSEQEYLNIANNKSTLVSHLKSHGVSTPNFRVVESANFQGLLQAFDELGYPNRPLVFKPSISNGSRGVRIVDNQVNKFDLLFNHKPNSLYMTYDEMCAILEKVSFPELLVSEYLPGEEYTIDSINYNGQVKLIIPRIRTRTSGGISVEGQFVQNQDIIAYAKAILNTMCLHGPIGLQVKQGEDGSFKILEINPRIQGTSVAALGAGINLPLLAVHQEIGSDLEINQENIYWNRHFVRYWQEIYY